MSKRGSLPENPLEFIKSCVSEQRIYWTYHVNVRLGGRSISRRMILDSIDRYEVIEEYPEDRYLPSYLVYSKYKREVFHIVFAADIENDNVRVITAYRPSRRDWKEDLKTRRKTR